MDPTSHDVLANLTNDLTQRGPMWYSGVEDGTRPLCGLTRQIGDRIKSLKGGRTGRQAAAPGGAAAAGGGDDWGKYHTRVLAMRLTPQTAAVLTKSTPGTSGGVLCIWFPESSPGSELGLPHGGGAVELPGPNGLLLVQGSTLDEVCRGTLEGRGSSVHIW